MSATEAAPRTRNLVEIDTLDRKVAEELSGATVLAYALDGPITEADLEELDRMVQAHESFRLLLRVDDFEFPPLSAFSGTLVHMKRLAIKRTERYAVVGGPKWMESLLSFAGGVTPMEVRHFTDEAEAWAWIGEAPQAPDPAIRLIDTGSDRVVGIRTSGRIDLDAFRLATDQLDAAMAAHDSISYYAEVESFKGITLEALREDLTYGLKHMRKLFSKIDRMALVTDIAWVRRIARIEGALIPGIDLKTFSFEHRERALTWVRGDDLPPLAHVPGLVALKSDRPTLVAVAIKGELHTADYTDTFEPLIGAALAANDEVDILIRVDEFHGLSFGALHEDVELAPLASRIGRLAVVGGPGWLSALMSVTGPFVAADIRSFHAEEEESARAWLDADDDKDD